MLCKIIRYRACAACNGLNLTSGTEILKMRLQRCYLSMKPGLLLLTFFWLHNASAQGIFRDVTAVQYGDSILLNWTLTAGNTCFDMYLQRSADGSAFETVYAVGGVCGGVDDQYYDYIDSETLQSGVYYAYRVTGSLNTYISDTVTLTFVDAGNRALFVHPNPVQDMVGVTIDNTYTPTFLYEVFTIEGKHISIGQSAQNTFNLDAAAWTAGAYILKITTRNGESFAHTFIVQ